MQDPVQTIEFNGSLAGQAEIPEQGNHAPQSPFKKFLPLVIIIVVILIIGSLVLLLVAGKSRSKKVDVPSTPTARPTATPFAGQSSATLSITPTSTAITSAKIGRLAFIKDGDIYNSDLTTLSLLVKNATPAADKLSWSGSGNYLAWRSKAAVNPAGLTLYDRKKDISFSIAPTSNLETEIIDYAWSPKEDQIVILFRDTSYKISVFQVKSTQTNVTNILIRDLPVSQLLWPKDKTIIFSGADGISSIGIGDNVPINLVSNNTVVDMKLSPVRDKLLYSVGDDSKSDLYLVNLDGTQNELINPKPAQVNMGTTNLAPQTLNNGFTPYAVWFPKGDKLLLGYHFLTNLPLVGVYDLKASSFTAISPFALSANDYMIDELRLLGARNKDTQVYIFTMEEGAKLATQRVFTDASSPTFFPGKL